MRHPKETAFSLPEIAVALTILGILAVLVTPRAASFLVQARRGEAKVNLEHIKHLQAIYRVEHGSANSSAWEVGYIGSGVSKCNNTAAELFNPLGFNPKGCSSLRYLYYIDGTDYYAYGRSDHAGKWIYPDCEGGWTTKECGKKSGDLIRTSDSTSISVCRNIVEYCPTAHGGTPTPTPTTPTPTPTLCVSAGITCPTGKTLNTTRAGSTVAACCDCPDGSNIAGSCTCDNQVGTDKDTNSSVCRNAPNNGTWNGSETDLSKCCILPTPPKCSSLDLTRNNRDRNRDKDTDTFTNEIECYCPASSPKWDTTATPHPACAPTCDSLRTDGSRCISADYKGPPNSTVATNLSFKNTCCCPVGQHWDSDSSTCCVDADHDNNCDSCVAPKTGTPPTCVCPDIQPGDHSCEAWESWDTAASDCCSCSSGNVKVIGSDTVCCSTNTPTSCNGTWSFTGNKTNATCACTPYTCLGFTDCGSDQLKNPLPTINRTPTKELCCEAPNVPAPPEAPTCATFETRECTDTNTHKRAHLTWQNTDTSNPSQANCCKCIATEVTNDPAGLEVGINTKWCCKNQPSGADCAPPRKWHNTERSAPITAKYCECKCPNSKKFEGGQCVDTCKTIDAKDGVDCNNGSRKDESDQFTATIANFQTICCEVQDPLELKSCRAYVDDEQEKTGDEDGEGEEDGPLTPNAICGDGFLYGGAAVNDDTFEFNQAGDANADTENFTAFRATCCRASTSCSAYDPIACTGDNAHKTWSNTATYDSDVGKASCCTCSGSERTIRDSTTTCCKYTTLPSGKTSCANIGTWTAEGNLPNVSCTCRPYNCQYPPPLTSDGTDYPECETGNEPTTVEGELEQQRSHPLTVPMARASYTPKCCVPIQTIQGCSDYTSNQKQEKCGLATDASWQSNKCKCNTLGKVFDYDNCNCKFPTCLEYVSAFHGGTNRSNKNTACSTNIDQITIDSTEYGDYTYKTGMGIDGTTITTDSDNTTIPEAFKDDCCENLSPPTPPPAKWCTQVTTADHAVTCSGLGEFKSAKEITGNPTDLEAYCCCPQHYTWDEPHDWCEATCANVGGYSLRSCDSNRTADINKSTYSTAQITEAQVNAQTPNTYDTNCCSDSCAKHSDEKCNDYDVTIRALTTTVSTANAFQNNCCRDATCKEWRDSSPPASKLCKTGNVYAGEMDVGSTKITGTNTFDDICCKAQDSTPQTPQTPIAPPNCYWNAFYDFYKARNPTTRLSALECTNSHKELIKNEWAECYNESPADNKGCHHVDLPDTRIAPFLDKTKPTIDEALEHYGHKCGGIKGTTENCFRGGS